VIATAKRLKADVPTSQWMTRALTQCKHQGIEQWQWEDFITEELLHLT
jgi:hypothetical protein